MTDSQSSFSRLIQELRNRRVFRVSTVYVGISFALIEVSDILFPMINAPGWSLKALVVLLLLGLPAAVALSWMFQVTPDGLKRSPKSGEKQTKDQKPLTSNAIVIALLIIIAGLLAYPRFSNSNSEMTTASAGLLLDSKSIAVLPFTPFTKTAEDESFADGVHDDILTQLSKIGELKVISRTSVMQYKNTTKPIPEIAAELGVVNLLEGSVRRAGDQIRIVAQLINAKTDEHLWAETFDRKYADIFTVQTEVAKKIAKALKAKLTPKEQQYIDTMPTENQAAWNLYLRGQLLAIADVVDKDSVAVFFNQAIALDPEFLLPYTKLTRIHAYKYFDGSGTDPTKERLKKARNTLDQALSINPDAPETHLAQGYFYYYGSRDYELALEEFSIAREAQPNNSDLFAATGYVERRLGRYEQALESLQKAVSLDPNDASKVEEARGWAYMMRNMDLAQRYQNQLSAIHSGNEALVEVGHYWIEAGRYGNLDKMQAIMDRLLLKFEPSELGEAWWMQSSYNRDFDLTLEFAMADTNSSFWDIGDLLQRTGKTEEARAYFDSARMDAEQTIDENPQDWMAYGELGVSLAKLGRFDEAIDWGKREVELMPLSRDGLDGVIALEDLAEIYLMCGEEEASIDLYEKILELPIYTNVSFMRLDPLYDPLRDNPRFQKLLETAE